MIEYKTYEQWKAAGFQVLKGERSGSLDEQGEAVFERCQVKSLDKLDEFAYRCQLSSHTSKSTQKYRAPYRQSHDYEYDGSWEETIVDTFFYQD